MLPSFLSNWKELIGAIPAPLPPNKRTNDFFLLFPFSPLAVIPLAVKFPTFFFFPRKIGGTDHVFFFFFLSS